MKIIQSLSLLQKTISEIRRTHKTIGFVPTMGALHQGHLSLIRHAKKDNHICLMSIFVNPTQFGPKEDYNRYPRNKKKDVLLAKQENVDIIFYPSEKLIYPPGYLTYVEVTEISNVLCGRTRPGHFKGVATVVTKLLNMIQPDRMYLGAKDYQQCVILQQLITDLNFSVKIKICPTVREPDGLALSSRNQYLSVSDRKEAVILFQSLEMARGEILKGVKDALRIRYLIEQNIRKTRGEIDYIACVDSKTLQPLTILKGNVVIALAVRWGTTRLIDNMMIAVK